MERPTRRERIWRGVALPTLVVAALGGAAIAAAVGAIGSTTRPAPRCPAPTRG